jgi:peptidoglycan hydrolase-like protein with peptidoglycan-binding domain
MRLFVPLCSVLLLLFCATIAFASDGSVATIGSRGSKVREIQSYLYSLNYLKGQPDGIYGKITAEAVKAFQLEHDLKPTGKVGPMSFDILKESFDNQNNFDEYVVQPGETLVDIAEKFNSSVAAIMVRNDLPGNEVEEGQVLQIPVGNKYHRSVASRGRTGGIQAIPWSIVDKLWKTGEDALITDLKTGRSFTVRRLGGRYHSDVEPVKANDAKEMARIVGRWTWDRRAITVTIRNLRIAASMNGMPHGVQNIFGNWFDGHFCVHFLGSRVHVTSSVDALHLSKIEEAESTIEIDKEEILSVPSAVANSI